MPDLDRPRLLRGSAPSAPICRARIKLADRTVSCGRAFADNQDVCRCGAKRPPESDQDHGYTTVPGKAMKGEGEAVPAQAQEVFSKDAAERHEDRKQESWNDQRERLLTVVRDIRQDAIKPAVREHLKGIERQIRSLDRKLAK